MSDSAARSQAGWTASHRIVTDATKRNQPVAQPPPVHGRPPRPRREAPVAAPPPRRKAFVVGPSPLRGEAFVVGPSPLRGEAFVVGPSPLRGEASLAAPSPTRGGLHSCPLRGRRPP